MQLTTTSLGHRFAQGPWLFRGLDLRFAPGLTTALVGPSGTGKSTLLALLAGTLRPTEGSVSRVGVARIARISQAAHGVANRAAGDHIALPLLARGATRREAEVQVRSIAEMFHLETLVSAPFRQLSGGEAQRLMLARAVAMEADLILADEPTAALDTGNASGVIDVLSGLSSRGAIVVVATHDARAKTACADVVDLGQLSQPVTG